MTEVNHSNRFRVGDLSVDLTRREVHRGKELLPVKGLSFELLACLMRHHPSLASTRAIHEEVWGDNIVAPAALGQRVRILREALGRPDERSQYVGVVKSRGYQLLVPVTADARSRFRNSMASALAIFRRQSGKHSLALPTVFFGVITALTTAFIQNSALGNMISPTLGQGYSLRQYPAVWVRPFGTGSSEAGAAHWVEGIRQEIIDDLRKFDGLEVVSQVGEDGHAPLARLEPDAVLHGDVSIVHGTVTLAARLSDPEAKRDLWSRTYSLPLSVAALEAMQVDVSRQVARRVDPADSVGEITAPETSSIAAYELFLRARYHAGQYNPADMRKAMELVDRAIEIDPEFASAYELRAMIHSYSGTPSYGWQTPDQAFRDAREDALRALSLDPGRASALTVIGDILLWQEWNAEAARRAFVRANELDPRDLGTLFSLAFFHSALGQHDASIEFIDQAIAIAPHNPRCHVNAGWRLIEARRFDAAIAAARTALTLDPGLVDAHRIEGWALSYQGRHEQALDAMARSGNQAAYAYALAKAGRLAEAVSIRDDLIAQSTREFVYPGTIAIIFIALGEQDAALDWLERAFQHRTRALVHLKTFPAFEALHSDPRFEDLAQRVGLWHDGINEAVHPVFAKTSSADPL